MTKTYLLSDTHFNHTNICGPALSSWSRGYRHFSSLNEMNDTIIDNTNAIVGKDDEIIFGGDFAFGDKKLIPSLRERINCRNIHVILGNHDHALSKYYRNSFTSVKKYMEFRFKKKLVCIFHYPIHSWNEMGRGSVHFHGHQHNSYDQTRNLPGRKLDFGVDGNNFKPWLLDDAFDFCMSKEPVFVDHHDNKVKGW